MGSQQLLVIVIAVVILAVAVAVGITWFRDQAASSNRDELAMDISQLGVRAQAFVRRPTTLGGGGGTFRGLTIGRLTSKAENMNGTYAIDPANPSESDLFIKIVGTGTEAANDGLPVKVVFQVFADSMTVLEDEGH